MRKINAGLIFTLLAVLVCSLAIPLVNTKEASADGGTWIPMDSGTTIQLNGVWASSADNVFAVGYQGTILHYDGNNWTAMDSGTTEDFVGIWGLSPSNIFACGDMGIMHFDGITWSLMDDTGAIYNFWGTSETDIYAAGWFGTILQYNGNTWTQMNTSITEHLEDIWGISSSNIFAIGRNGAIIHYDGAVWTAMNSDVTDNLTCVWGTSATDVFAAGDSTILHYDGSTWNAMDSGGTQYISGIWGSSPSDIFTVGGGEHLIYHYDGNNWKGMDIWAPNGLTSISGSSPTNIFAVGIDGIILQYREDIIPNNFQNSVPLPSEISTDPKVVGTNAALALALVLLFYAAATIFNSAIRENYETIRLWLRRIFRLPNRRVTIPASRKTVREYLAGLAVVLITALIYCFIDPYFTHGITFLALFISLFVAIAIVTFFYDGIQTLLLKHSSRVPAIFRIRPIAIVIAIIFVLISRTFHFHPGLTLGFVGACVPLVSARKLKRGRRAIPILISVLLIVAISALAFGLRVPVHDALAGGDNFGLALLEMIFVAVFVLGLEGLVFSLLPLIFVDGYSIFRWKWWIWLIVSSIVVFLFFHIIINQDGEIVEAVSDTNTQMMIWLTGICLVISIVVWLFFAIRKKRGKGLSGSD